MYLDIQKIMISTLSRFTQNGLSILNAVIRKPKQWSFQLFFAFQKIWKLTLWKTAIVPILRGGICFYE